MDRKDFYFRQKVNEGEVDDGFDGSEQADRNQNIDMGLVGVSSGLNVVPAGNSDITVNVLQGVGYQDQGKRISVTGTQNVDCSLDLNQVTTVATTDPKIVSVFIAFDRSLSDPRIDGNSNPVDFLRDESFKFVIRQGAEAATPTPPSLVANEILLVDITIIPAQTEILSGDIDTSRAQFMFDFAAGALTIHERSPEEAASALLTLLEDHITTSGHPATAISYAGGGNWADGTNIAAGDLEAAIDEIVSDLASTVGADKIGFGTGVAWHDAATIAAVRVDTAIEEIVNDLTNAAGSDRIGQGSIAGSPFTVAASGSIDDAIASVLGDLNTLATDLADTSSTDGAAEVGAKAVSQTGFDLTLGTVRSQLDELLTLINEIQPAQVFVPLSGGGTEHSVQWLYNARQSSTWLDGTWKHILVGTNSAIDFDVTHLLPVGANWGGAEARVHGLGGSTTTARASAPTTKLTIELLEYSSSGAESQIAIEEDGAQWDGAYETSHFTGVSTGGKTIEVFKRYVIRIQGEVGGGAAGNRMVIQSLTISWNP